MITYKIFKYVGLVNVDVQVLKIFADHSSYLSEN